MSRRYRYLQLMGINTWVMRPQKNQACNFEVYHCALKNLLFIDHTVIYDRILKIFLFDIIKILNIDIQSVSIIQYVPCTAVKLRMECTHQECASILTRLQTLQPEYMLIFGHDLAARVLQQKNITNQCYVQDGISIHIFDSIKDIMQNTQLKKSLYYRICSTIYNEVLL